MKYFAHIIFVTTCIVSIVFGCTSFATLPLFESDDVGYSYNYPFKPYRGGEYTKKRMELLASIEDTIFKLNEKMKHDDEIILMGREAIKERIQNDIETIQKALVTKKRTSPDYQRLEKELNTKHDELNAVGNLDDLDNLKKKGRELINQKIKKFESHLRNIGGIKGSADIVARGLAGSKNWEQLKDMTLGNDWKDGVKQGLMARAAGSIGDCVGEKVETTVQKILGGLWDNTLDTITNFFEIASSWLFHHGKKGFNKEELTLWSGVIESCFSGFSQLTGNHTWVESRSKSTDSRAFENDGNTENINQGQQMSSFLLEHYADQFEFYACVIEDRIGFYSPKKYQEIIFVAQQLKKWLEQMTLLLKGITSLKEASAKIGSNAQLVPQISINISTLFAKLISLVEKKDGKSASGRGTVINTQAKQLSRFGGMNNAGGMGGTSYPQSFGVYDAN